MKDFSNFWKEKARTNNLTVEDVFQHCLLRAIVAKNPDKNVVMTALLQKAFTPITNEKTLMCQGKRPYQAVYNASNHSRYDEKSFKIGNPYSDNPVGTFEHLLDAIETSEEASLYIQLRNDSYAKLADLLPSVLDKIEEKKNIPYTYILVRQDILSPEQQIVQASHVAFKLGHQLGCTDGVWAQSFKDYDNLHHIVCGVADGDELDGAVNYLYSNGYESVQFVEPDVGNQVTAIASFPIKAKDRKFMNQYKLLRFPILDMLASWIG